MNENHNFMWSCLLCESVIIGGSKMGRQGRTSPGGPNSFIFMQFSGTKLKNNSTFWELAHPLGKILDPPLVISDN